MPWISIAKVNTWCNKSIRKAIVEYKQEGFLVFQEYDQMRNADLKELLVSRGLPHSGNKEAMVMRLKANDEAQ